MLKSHDVDGQVAGPWRFSALQRAEIAEMGPTNAIKSPAGLVSVLFNEPKLLKFNHCSNRERSASVVSVLFNEPKLLKFEVTIIDLLGSYSFSALQRAEIAEMVPRPGHLSVFVRVSVLFNEPKLLKLTIVFVGLGFRAVSVLFNEPKLLKSCTSIRATDRPVSFQCSSTSRNC